VPAQWRVDQNTGARADLSCRMERKEVRRPMTMSEEEFYELLRPGTFILDRLLITLSNW
jgi:hypothetical protein